MWWGLVFKIIIRWYLMGLIILGISILDVCVGISIIVYRLGLYDWDWYLVFEDMWWWLLFGIIDIMWY